MTTSTELPQLPFRQDNLLEAPPQLRELQTGGAIHRVRTLVGDEAWLITDYAHVRRLLDDDRLGRSHPEPDKAAKTNASPLFGGPIGNFESEVADQARTRALLQPHFSPRHMRELGPRVEVLTAGLLDEMASGGQPADLHAKVAAPLPVLVICELLGVPYDDRDQFRAWTEDASCLSDSTRAEGGMAELFGYGMSLIQRKRAQPADDVISRLCATEGVDDLEAAATSMVLLFAGHETTVVQISWGALQLLTNPDQWQKLRDDPALIPHAVEELLRASMKGGTPTSRYARTDLDIDGVRIRAGDLVLLDFGAANHDPATFPEPDRLDVSRSVGAHLAFGYGAHYCLGAPLARIEMTTVFTQLIARFPSLRLAVDPSTLTVRSDMLTGGLVELPVAW